MQTHNFFFYNYYNKCNIRIIQLFIASRLHICLPCARYFFSFACKPTKYSICCKLQTFTHSTVTKEQGQENSFVTVPLLLTHNAYILYIYKVCPYTHQHFIVLSDADTLTASPWSRRCVSGSTGAPFPLFLFTTSRAIQ